MTRKSALALAVLLATSSWAGPKPKLLRGEAEFKRGDFQGALKLLDAEAEKENDEETLGRIHLLRGQAFGALQDFALAEAAFARALENDPTVELDPNKVDPSLVKMLDGLRGRLKGELRVKVDRPGARVFLDGRPLGAGPVKTSVSIGRHKVEARSVDGDWVARETVVVGTRRATELTLKLGQTGKDDPSPTPDAPPAPEYTWKPFGDLRLSFDIPIQPPELLSFEVGGGLKYRYFSGSIRARVVPVFGLIPRGTVGVPVAEGAFAYLAVDVPVIFVGYVALGIGGNGGVEYFVSPWFSVWGEIGGRQFFTGYSGGNRSRLNLEAGVRLHLP